MQLNTNIKQLDSREYKLILAHTKFLGTNKDKDLVTTVFEDCIDKLDLTFNKSTKEPKIKTVWYLDTDKHDLHDRNDFVIRVKESKKDNDKVECDVTFKVRTFDKNKTSQYDLYEIKDKGNYKIEEQKFEEDIISQLGSKFSISTEFEFKEKEYREKFEGATCADVLAIFPNLKLDVLGFNLLSEVNGIRVKETKYKLGELLSGTTKKAEVEFCTWSLLDDSPRPIIGEFDIDVNAKDLIPNDNDKVNPFSDPVIEKIDSLYAKIQEHDIIDKHGTTKTQFIYNYNNLKK
ncbi:MAG: hypothetical protein R2685_16200 [Candidatus Nitrosocosmicus sp.]|nr:hypothetical protein [Candidatus Nitrosocosmicus sp.]